MSIKSDVADAVVAELNATEFSIKFVAERVHGKAQLQLTNLDCLRVEVFPVGTTLGLADRGSAGHEVTIDIVIRKKLGPQEADQATGEVELEPIDELDNLTEEIGIHFQPEQPDRTGRLAEYEDAAWLSGRILSGYGFDKDRTQIYMGQVRLVFDV